MKVDHGFLIQNLQKQIASLQSVYKDPPAEPSTPSMPQLGISPLSAGNMDLSEALAVVDKVVGDSTAVIQRKEEDKKSHKKTIKKPITPTRWSERLNPTPPSMIIRIKKQPRNRMTSKRIGSPFMEQVKKKQHVVCNIESDSVQQSSSIRLSVPGFIEERRDYDGHDLLSDDEKRWIERFLSIPITYKTVLTTTKGTEVGGNHIHDILFDGSMTEGYVIDAYFDILDERILNEDVKNYWRCPTACWIEPPDEGRLLSSSHPSTGTATFK
ncbi:hypothetical protein QJS10_CPA01g01507 [Acorus calamus]|uniref:Uncharacterized protein n=1 Tax=Acorus calamus TaxID=4465 RepID=A0AAV9FKG7_ACOCL|nr:hypothetical protein QJS10_CPA01g01507 [Acorus calamus]